MVQIYHRNDVRLVLLISNLAVKLYIVICGINCFWFIWESVFRSRKKTWMASVEHLIYTYIYIYIYIEREREREREKGGCANVTNCISQIQWKFYFSLIETNETIVTVFCTWQLCRGIYRTLQLYLIHEWNCSYWVAREETSLKRITVRQRIFVITNIAPSAVCHKALPGDPYIFCGGFTGISINVYGEM